MNLYVVVFWRFVWVFCVFFGLGGFVWILCCVDDVVWNCWGNGLCGFEIGFDEGVWMLVLDVCFFLW